MKEVLRAALFVGTFFVASVWILWLVGGSCDLATLHITAVVVPWITAHMTLIARPRRARRHDRPPLAPADRSSERVQLLQVLGQQVDEFVDIGRSGDW